MKLVREIDHPWVGATFDVGHQSHYSELVARVPDGHKSVPESVKAYNDINISIVRGLGDRLIHLHCHDIDPAT